MSVSGIVKVTKTLDVYGLTSRSEDQGSKGEVLASQRAVDRDTDRLAVSLAAIRVVKPQVVCAAGYFKPKLSQRWAKAVSTAWRRALNQGIGLAG
jgi:hypothetical protein